MDDKASSGTGLGMVADTFRFPDKEEVDSDHLTGRDATAASVERRQHRTNRASRLPLLGHIGRGLRSLAISSLRLTTITIRWLLSNSHCHP